MKIVSVAQMKAIEQAANETGISYEAMMENAGSGVAEWAYGAFGSHQGGGWTGRFGE